MIARARARVVGATRGILAERAPRATTLAAVAHWRRRNRARALVRDDLLDPRLNRLLADLRRNGVARATSDDLFATPTLFGEASDAAFECLRASRERGAAGTSNATKPFLTRLFTGAASVDHAFVRLALDHNVLAVVNNYLRIRGVLRALELWLTEPTAGPAVETQLWHRDPDDVMTVKLFVCFTDVTEAAGPFCYAPGTHPLGRLLRPAAEARGRATDDAMAAVVPRDDWVVCTGAAGTVVLADTCGYHKQLKPEGDERLALVAQYTSGNAVFAPDVTISGADLHALTVDQRYALLHEDPQGSSR